MSLTLKTSLIGLFGVGEQSVDKKFENSPSCGMDENVHLRTFFCSRGKITNAKNSHTKFFWLGNTNRKSHFLAFDLRFWSRILVIVAIFNKKWIKRTYILEEEKKLSARSFEITHIEKLIYKWPFELESSFYFLVKILNLLGTRGFENYPLENKTNLSLKSYPFRFSGSKIIGPTLLGQKFLHFHRLFSENPH